MAGAARSECERNRPEFAMAKTEYIHARDVRVLGLTLLFNALANVLLSVLWRSRPIECVAQELLEFR